MIKRAIKKWILGIVDEYIKDEKPDIQDMEIEVLKRNLQGFEYDENLQYDYALPEDKRVTLYSTAYDIMKYDTFRAVKNYLINRYVEETARHAKSVTELSFNRGTINGIEQLFDEMGRLAREYESMQQDDRDDVEDKETHYKQF